MADFYVRYKVARDTFYKATKQFPQLITSAQGEAKASGLDQNLPLIDQALDAPGGVDFEKLTSAYQNFQKNAIRYIEHITQTPGKGVLEWMKKTSTTAPTKKDEEKIIDETLKFRRSLEILLEAIDSRMEIETKHVAGRKDRAKILQSLKDEIADWPKYLNLSGFKLAANPKSADVCVKIGMMDKPSRLLIDSSEELSRMADLFNQLVKATAEIDTKTVLASSMKKNIVRFETILDDFERVSDQMFTMIVQWTGSIADDMTKHTQSLMKKNDEVALAKFNEQKKIVTANFLAPMDIAKRKIQENVKYKIVAGRKILASFKH